MQGMFLSYVTFWTTFAPHVLFLQILFTISAKHADEPPPPKLLLKKTLKLFFF
jgi:hypothetical protein